MSHDKNCHVVGSHVVWLSVMYTLTMDRKTLGGICSSVVIRMRSTVTFHCQQISLDLGRPECTATGHLQVFKYILLKTSSAFPKFLHRANAKQSHFTFLKVV